MVATERELAEDAQWKRIQQNTFTRWANEHLKTVNKHIGNLETDLCDGLRLITLIEVLSGKRLPKHTKRPTFRSQKLENVSVALKFLEEDESIRIVNIGKYSQNIDLDISCCVNYNPMPLFQSHVVSKVGSA
ncbi:Filamin-A [Blattella germanica]|nr:Filamin-A [Blattella germanica]